jgi:hypothetical protein
MFSQFKLSPPLSLYLLLILHNRLEDDSVAGDLQISMDVAKVDPDFEAARDLLVGVVFPKKYEEPGKRGSSAHFLSGCQIMSIP